MHERVAVIGGGVGGLYVAWRLLDHPDIDSVIVFEQEEQVGGRYLTCEMPGGFLAEMGAMRYLPKSHIILDNLVNQFDIKTRDFIEPVDEVEPTAGSFYRGKQVKNVCDVFDINDKDKSFSFLMEDLLDSYDAPSNSDWTKLMLKDGRLANDMSGAEYMITPGNPEVLNLGNPYYLNNNSLLCELGWVHQFVSSTRKGEPREGLYQTICNGMKTLPGMLAQKINSSTKGCVKLSHPVTKVEEVGNLFKLTALHDGVDYQTLANRVIFAIPPKAQEIIDWQRMPEMQKHFANIERASACKVFLTYSEPWWHKAGLNCGSLLTDLPISECIAFGKPALKENCATILAAFTYKYAYMFEAMNKATPKFQAARGNVPERLRPSLKLVDFVHKQLCQMLCVTTAPLPVCAAAIIWSEVANCHYKPRVNVMKLQWQMLKPFKDSHAYFLSDGFAPWDKTGWNGAFSEGSLLNAERILANHFGMKKYCQGIDVYPLTAKL